MIANRHGFHTAGVEWNRRRAEQARTLTMDDIRAADAERLAMRERRGPRHKRGCNRSAPLFDNRHRRLHRTCGQAGSRVGPARWWTWAVTASASTGKGVEASGDIGLSVALKGTVDLVPYVSLKCINERYEYPVKLAEYDLITWSPKLAGVKWSSDKGLSYQSLQNTSNVTVNVPDFAKKGMIADFVDWIDSMNEENDAHAVVTELSANGMLDLLPVSEKARLLSLIKDDVVMEAHEGSILKLIRSEADRTKREALVVAAYEQEFGKKGSVADAKKWLRASMDDHWFGDDNEAAFDSLFQ